MLSVCDNSKIAHMCGRHEVMLKAPLVWHTVMFRPESPAALPKKLLLYQVESNEHALVMVADLGVKLSSLI